MESTGSTKRVENNPPELPTGDTSTNKRNTTGGDVSVSPSKRHKPANVRQLRNNRDLDLLVHIQDYHDKLGSYPFDDVLKQRWFYKNWIEGNDDYKDFIEMNQKMEELNGKFWDNFVRKSNGEDVEGFMDDVDKEIFRLSNVIWGKKENDRKD